MSTVDIQQMPEWARKARFQPHRLPIFTVDGPATQEDCELALELWRALDPASKRWYVRDPSAREFVELPLTQADIDSMGVRERDQRRHRHLPLKPALLSDAIPRRAAP